MEEWLRSRRLEAGREPSAEPPTLWDAPDLDEEIDPDDLPDPF
jgi:hypothetical protein